MRRPYTKEEKQYIFDHYADTSNEDISKAIGRSKDSILKFAATHGLRKRPDFIAATDNRADAVDYAVVADDEVVFVGHKLKCANFIGVSKTAVNYAIKNQSRVGSYYHVRPATPDDKPTGRRAKSGEVTTDAMDWPLWFFKAGMAPSYAFQYGKVH